MVCIDCFLFDKCEDPRRFARKPSPIGHTCKKFIIRHINEYMFILNGVSLDRMCVEPKMKDIHRMIDGDEVLFQKIKYMCCGKPRFMFIGEYNE